VDRYPDQFPDNVVAIARTRIAVEEARFAPTADAAELDTHGGFIQCHAGTVAASRNKENRLLVTHFGHGILPPWLAGSSL